MSLNIPDKARLLVNGGTPSRPDSPIGADHLYPSNTAYSGYLTDGSSLPSPYPQDNNEYFPDRSNSTQGLNRTTTNTRQATGHSRWQWMFLVIVIVQAIIGLAIEAFVFAKFQEDLASWARSQSGAKPYAATVPTYLALFIFGFVYEVGLVWDALRLKNTIQVIGLCLYNVGLLIEAAVQFLQLSDVVKYLSNQAPPSPGQGPALQGDFKSQVHPYIIAMPAVIGLGSVLMAICAFYLRKEFKIRVWERFGADKGMKYAVRSYEVYISLLKFDFFFFLAFTVLFLVVVQDTGDAESYLTIAALPVTVLVFALAVFVVRRESKYGMAAIITLYFAALAYFFFKLFRMYLGPQDRVKDYKPARRSLTTFAVLTIVLLVTTIASAIVCTLNFGKGLRAHLTKKRTKSYQSEMQYLTHAPPPTRVDID